MSVILIVEDNDKNMKLFRDVLQFAGHEILEATTGRAGLELAITGSPDLILMDIQLPDTDGMAVLQALRARGQVDVPVLAVSASVMPDDQQRILASGFDGFIMKPINVKGFMAAVQQALEKGR
jgi:two-component system cell cycle response regulator DivK